MEKEVKTRSVTGIKAMKYTELAWIQDNSPVYSLL